MTNESPKTNPVIIVAKSNIGIMAEVYVMFKMVSIGVSNMTQKTKIVDTIHHNAGTALAFCKLTVHRRKIFVHYYVS